MVHPYKRYQVTESMEVLKYILLRTRSQSKEPLHCIIPTIWKSEKNKTVEKIK